MLIPLLLFMVTTIGALISGLTGLAGGAVVLGGLMLFFPALEALAMHGVVQTASNGARVAFWSKSVQWPVVIRYSILLLPGAWLAGLCFHFLNIHLVEAFLGILILTAVWWKPPRTTRWQFSLNGFVWLGLVSGFFSMLAGVVGPLLNPFFDKLGIKREEMVSTKSACLLILHIARIGSYTGAVGVNFFNYKLELSVMIVASLLGLVLARPVGKMITDQQLDIVLKVLLTLLGGKNLAMGVYSYLA
jgi:uncharacterized membrane protein YfcA